MGITKKIFLKTISYKTMSIGASLCVTYLITGSWKVAGGVALFEAIGKVALYVAHEWLWESDIKKKKKKKNNKKVYIQ